ncbi:kit ligand-like [Antennarius striatus]|uniref:kit ligand-like n=1 Tax=Antennarius striatus TaxID=241820 RepID=UPI0035B4EF16
MRKKILKSICVLLSLFTSLNLCCGKFTTPITDDVSKLSLLKQNIPSDYEIPVSYIPKEEAGTCWVVLNIFPLEQSLGKLANKFGAISSNKEHIIVFIAMVKSLRFTFNHDEVEAMMQVFQCHYRESRLVSDLYFDYIRDILQAATPGESDFSCKLEPCVNSPQTPGGHEEGHEHNWSNRTPLLVALIPFSACLVIIVWLLKSGRCLSVCNTVNDELEPSDVIPSVSLAVPLQTLTEDDAQPAGEAVPEHESG